MGTGSSYPPNPFSEGGPYFRDPFFRFLVLADKYTPFWRVKVGSWRRARILLTPEEYVDRLVAQGFSCGICKVHYWVSAKMLAVDHDHVSGEVRGLLCSRCNYDIGRRETLVACSPGRRFTPAQWAYLCRARDRPAAVSPPSSTGTR
jgi:hypothetical protein